MIRRDSLLKARLAGLEPTASASAGLRSIQLSYKRLIIKHAIARASGRDVWQFEARSSRLSTPG